MLAVCRFRWSRILRRTRFSPSTPARHTYEPGRPFKAWLAGIAHYKWIDRLRALDRDPAVSYAEDISEDIPIDDHGPAIVSALCFASF